MILADAYEVTIYETETGIPKRTLRVTSQAEVEMNTGPGESYVMGLCELGTQIIADGEIVDLPPRPSPLHVWQDGAWTDPRTETDRQDAIEAWRQRRAISKRELVYRASLPAFGIISEEDALAIADGLIPPSVVSLFSALPVEDQFDATLTWKMATIVERLHPFVLQWQQVLQLDDAAVDSLFGLTLDGAGFPVT